MTDERQVSDIMEMYRGELGEMNLHVRLMRKSLAYDEPNTIKGVQAACHGLASTLLSMSKIIDLLLFVEQERALTHERKLEDNK